MEEKLVNSKYYSKIKIEPSNELKESSESIDGNPGYIYVPYIIGEHTEESLKEYNDFMETYKNEHKLCPNCGSDGSYSMTLM